MAKQKQDKTDPGKRKGSKFVSVKEGRSRRASAEIKFRVHTQPAKRTVEDAIQPATWLYRELVGTLAHHGFGEAIGQVNQIINDRVQAAVEVANETGEKMEKAVDRHAERLGVEIEPRSLGEAHEVKMISVGGVTTKMIELAKAADRGVIGCDMAATADAVPYEAARDAVGSIIAHNRLVLAAVKKMREFVVRRVGGEQINVDDLVTDMTKNLERSIRDKSVSLGVTEADGKPRKAFQVEKDEESLGDESLDKGLKDWKEGEQQEPAAEDRPKPPSALRKLLAGSKN